MSEAEEGGLGGGWDRVLALLLALPAAALAWPGPGALLAGDLYPEVAGTGLAVLLALPAGLLLMVRRAAPRVAGLSLLLGFVGAGFVSLQLRAPADVFEARRAMMIALIGLVMLLGGASLGATGRAWLARALVSITALLLVPALFGSGAGALQNSGATSEAALPGAVCGAWLAARGRGGWAWFGGIAAGLEALYAGTAPVLAGALCLVVVLSLGAALSERRAPFAVVAAASALLFGVAWGLRVEFDAGARESRDPVALTEHPDVRGFDVRRRIWTSSADMLLDYGLLGVGPGQFAAAFPPYRDPLERQASDAPLADRRSEVEHAHNDWLQGAIDAGPIGGLLWVAFLVLVLARGVRALRLDAGRAALGAAAVAVLVNALVRAPLLWNPASATLGFALFGVALARPASGRSHLRRGVLFASVLALGLYLTQARAMVAHGDLDRGPTGMFRALEQCPESARAQSYFARQHAAGGSGDELEEQAWERVLELRPYRFEALVQLGNIQAESGRETEARALWMRAHALAPEHAGVLNNLMRGAAMSGDVEGALEWAERGGADSARRIQLGFDVLVLRGDVATAFALLGNADERLRAMSAQRAFELGSSPPPDLAGRATRLKGAAQLLWAREHVATGNLAAAVRSYRQARAGLSYHLPEVEEALLAPAVRMELGAALLLTERADEARRELGRGPPATPRDLAALPSWAGNALLSAGLLGTQ
jgi:O-antigen ligase